MIFNEFKINKLHHIRTLRTTRNLINKKNINKYDLKRKNFIKRKVENKFAKPRIFKNYTLRNKYKSWKNEYNGVLTFFLKNKSNSVPSRTTPLFKIKKKNIFFLGFNVNSLKSNTSSNPSHFFFESNSKNLFLIKNKFIFNFYFLQILFTNYSNFFLLTFFKKMSPYLQIKSTYSDFFLNFNNLNLFSYSLFNYNVYFSKNYLDCHAVSTQNFKKLSAYCFKNIYDNKKFVKKIHNFFNITDFDKFVFSYALAPLIAKNFKIRPSYFFYFRKKQLTTYANRFRSLGFSRNSTNIKDLEFIAFNFNNCFSRNFVNPVLFKNNKLNLAYGSNDLLYKKSMLFFKFNLKNKNKKSRPYNLYIYKNNKNKNLKHLNVFSSSKGFFLETRRVFNNQTIASLNHIQKFYNYDFYNQNLLAPLNSLFSPITTVSEHLFIYFSNPYALKEFFSQTFFSNSFNFFFLSYFSLFNSKTSKTIDELLCIRKTPFIFLNNILPVSNSFSFNLKRHIVQSFNYRKLSFFYSYLPYHTLIKFIEYCTGRQSFFKIDPFILKSLSINEISKCIMWSNRIKIFRKILGPRLFLAESLQIITLCLKLKDPYILSNWMLSMFYKISFWKYKMLFRYMQYVLRYFFWPSFSIFGVKGLKFQLKGKVSVAGNARTRTVLTKIGAIGHSTFNNRVLTNLNLLRTFTGVIGFRTWLVF